MNNVKCGKINKYFILQKRKKPYGVFTAIFHRTVLGKEYMFTIMKKVLEFLKPYKLQLTIGPFFKLSEAVLEILIPTLMAMLIDNGINAANRPYVLRMGLFMLCTATAGVLFAYICQYSASLASQGFGTDVRNAMYKKIGTLSHSQLDRLGTPSLINRITVDVNQLQYAVAMLIRLVIRAPFLCVGGLVMAMILDLKLSVIFMIVIPAFIILLFLVMFKTVPLYKSVQKKLDHLTLILREHLSGVRVIRAFARTDYERERFCTANSGYADTAIGVGRIAALTNPATTLLMNAAIVAVIWFGGMRVNTGSLTQGQVIAYINYITQILNAMIIVANLVVLYTKAYASALRVGEVLELEPEITAQNAETDKKGAKIEFSDVSLRYSEGADAALDGINLSIEKGETIGIIGVTGSGKSSLVSLIPRFYDATEGSVTVDGRDVRSYEPCELRKKIGIVQQRAVLFSGTVRDNVKMGKQDADDSEVMQAIRAAQAEEFVSRLPYGLDTQISQNGANLSGGQKQRLTVARALIRKPEVLILDDSSSALDFKTDAALRASIKENTADMTVIIVSQRVNTVRGADRIVVMDDGKIADCGTHAELLERCELYREICISQEAGE